MNKSTKILLATLLSLVFLAAVILYTSSTVFLQLFLAFALAYMLNPAVVFLERKRVGRVLSILIVFTAALVVFVGIVVFFVVSLGSELSSMQLNLPAYAQHLYEVTPAAVKSYLGIENPTRLSLRLDEVITQARGITPDIVKPILNLLREAFTSTVAFILALLGYFIIPVYLFYLLADLPRLKEFVQSFIPERHRGVYNEKLGEIDAVLGGFIRGQLSVCAILAVLYSIGLYFIGIDLAVAIGTLAGITFIIPYVGTIIGICLSVVMAVLKFHDMLHPLLCLGWFCLVQALEGTVITPKIVGDTVGLHPLVAIIALLIGGQTFGIMGMLLAVPVTAVLQVFLRSLAVWYRESDFYRGV
ncbi:AI-2E family transporter [Geobacter sp. AOG2]|uniref:AI-2E family transporter n=1 Tax=Geobacter sp. AOG2 TaxID=1566347 RepID=UPI001CC6250D|nr:AI-2E family transporter [Geobacter sp. AOG2]GFE62451.1 AI-2E family transporter [Geobacter sp. AOG2]